MQYRAVKTKLCCKLHLAAVGFTALFAFAAVVRADQILANVYGRNPIKLDGEWHYIVDPYDVGYIDYRGKPYDANPRITGGFALDHEQRNKTDLVEYSFSKSPVLNVPGDWNSQDAKLLYYEGTVWYERRFDAPQLASGHRLFLYFGAANYEADVYLNGKKLGKHIGGFTPFAYEITDAVKPADNSLVVRVNNVRHQEGVPTVNTDWWNYGGITRDVLLLETPATFIASYRVQLKPGSPDRIEARVQLNGGEKEQTVKLQLPALGLSAQGKTDANGFAQFELAAPNLPLWSPEHPHLETVNLACDTDQISERIGFRTIETRGKDILLNGHPIFLRGVSIHEQIPQGARRAYSREDDRMLLDWAKELNCNFVRLAHYPHNEFMTRLADEMGIMVWEEIPVYWTIDWTNADTLDLAKAQLTDMITRDENRASTIVWSVANETPISDARTRFLKTLVDTARSADGTRLVSAAMEVHTDPKDSNHKIVDDPFGQYTDLVSFNEYIGWYDGLPEKASQVKWSIKYDKPVFISEFGAGALGGFHADARTRFSEEFQADVYRQNVAMLEKIPGFRGATPWILCDFRSPRRLLPQIQDGWNRKGLIGETGTKKEAFFVLKEFYDKMEKRAKAGDLP